MKNTFQSELITIQALHSFFCGPCHIHTEVSCSATSHPKLCLGRIFYKTCVGGFSSNCLVTLEEKHQFLHTVVIRT
ncbi:hypothetical protein F0562_005894 [Nyssa sinensis]|uniref:Uncharacterized protein n=1 Tax=Nyssa sinensis TaxID=561372 RepID=A0A5J5AN46_9ASTE|nr:hypothetical protein F0562_005894 [Nyssa sinensis]